MNVRLSQENLKFENMYWEFDEEKIIYVNTKI